ncbi:hypothetical protein [Bacillus sp. NEAU-Y102]
MGRQQSEGYVMGHIRMQTAAGWYIGSIEFLNGEASPWDKDEFSCYYPNESKLQQDYPRSMGMEEAFNRAERIGKYKPE